MIGCKDRRWKLRQILATMLQGVSPSRLLTCWVRYAYVAVLCEVAH